MILWEQNAKGKNAWVKVQPQEDLARALSGHAHQLDRYISVNEFWGWRRVALLRSLRACFVDLDDCPTVEAALYAVEEACLPTPNYAVHSGRGVHLYWLLDAVPAKALPMWQAIQAKLIRLLANVGADRAAGDCTRMLRLVGTVNSKSDTLVRGYVIEPGRWTLHQMADEVLGHRIENAAPVASIERARAVRRAVQSATGPFQLWHSRYLDLCTIADHHAFMRGGVEEGSRDKLLFLLANALSWFTRSDSLTNEIDRVARTFTPTLSSREVTTFTRPIIQRALQAADGHTIFWKGMPRDARYAFRTETLRDWLGKLITPDIEVRLRVLLPREQLDAREAARQRARDRVREGRHRQTRSQYLEQTKDRQMNALSLRDQGLTQVEIAKRLGINQSQVSRLLRSGICKSTPPV